MADLTADERLLAEFFEFEVCRECGWDADRHTVGRGGVGLPRIVCLDPIPEDTPAIEAERILAARAAKATGGGR